MARSYKYNRSRKELTLDQAKLRMTDAIKAVEKIILTSGNEQKQIQAVHALSNLIGQYCKLIEKVELLHRIEKLEEQMYE